MTASRHTEPYRPQFHFSPAQNWMNDPNGLVYHRGEYHLFFQHNPSGSTWGNMSWGHAVSRDLVHWTQLSVAIHNDADEMVFSGSAVIDHDNTTGFGTATNPAMVAIYTSARPDGTQRQAIACSLDNGRTFTKYGVVLATPYPQDPSATPSNNFRDPKVFWYAPGKTWLMAAVLADQHKVVLYSSPDLKHWTFLSTFGPAGATGGVWECPDLFPLPDPTHPGQHKWILIVSLNPGGIAGGSGTQYFIGGFDGKTFTADDNPSLDRFSLSDTPALSVLQRAHWLDFGSDNYAPITFNDPPNGKRIMIGWMNNWTYAGAIPTAPWRNAMTVPRELSLKSVNETLRLVQRPVAQLNSLASAPTTYPQNVPIGEGTTSLPASGDAIRINATLQGDSASRYGLKVRIGDGQETVIGYDRVNSEVYIDRSRSGNVSFDPTFTGPHRAPLAAPNGVVRLTILVDRSSIEVFADEGQVSLTDQIFPDPTSTGIAAFASGGSATLRSLTVQRLLPPRSVAGPDVDSS